MNPTCGDEVTCGCTSTTAMSQDVSYDGLGCSISQASTSVLHELLIGKSLDEAMAVHAAFLELMQSKGQVEPDEEVLGDAVAFAGVAKYPARVKCALLSWMAFKDATAQAASGLPAHSPADHDIIETTTHGGGPS